MDSLRIIRLLRIRAFWMKLGLDVAGIIKLVNRHRYFSNRLPVIEWYVRIYTYSNASKVSNENEMGYVTRNYNGRCGCANR